MKSSAPILLAVLCAGPTLLLAGCGGSAATSAPASAATHTTTISVSGMTCAACSVTVKAAVGKLDGIASIEVDVEAGRATVRYDGSKVTAEQIAAKISGAGYQAAVASTSGV